MTNFLLRERAPISDAAWAAIDEEARERLLPALAARKLVDFSGPHGWGYSATGLGRVREVAGAGDGLSALQRKVLPVVELYAPFTVSRAEMLDVDRGAQDADFDSLDEAARRIASAENTAVFHGWEAAAIAGIAEASTHEALALGEDCARYPHHVARAVRALLEAGVGGPYGLALGSQAYTHVQQFSEHGGYPLLQHLREIVGGPLVWSPGVRGAVVLSLRGGDFLFESGEDLAVGYDSHDGQSVRLYLVESFTFRAVTADAAVALTP
jgi:uncharacterized linocin/CFP29 family protein